MENDILAIVSKHALEVSPQAGFHFTSREFLIWMCHWKPPWAGAYGCTRLITRHTFSIFNILPLLQWCAPFTTFWKQDEPQAYPACLRKSVSASDRDKFAAKTTHAVIPTKYCYCLLDLCGALFLKEQA
jgi:hypothetical protein